MGIANTINIHNIAEFRWLLSEAPLHLLDKTARNIQGMWTTICEQEIEPLALEIHQALHCRHGLFFDQKKNVEQSLKTPHTPKTVQRAVHFLLPPQNLQSEKDLLDKWNVEINKKKEIKQKAIQPPQNIQDAIKLLSDQNIDTTQMDQDGIIYHANNIFHKTVNIPNIYVSKSDIETLQFYVEKMSQMINQNQKNSPLSDVFVKLKKLKGNQSAYDTTSLLNEMTCLLKNYNHKPLASLIELFSNKISDIINVIKFVVQEGHINFVEQDTQITLDRDKNYVVICNDGEWQGPAVAGFLDKYHDLPVYGVIAGISSAFNPLQEHPKKFTILEDNTLEQKTFEEVYGRKKPPVVGVKELPPGVELETSRIFYQKYVDALPANLHVIAFEDTLSPLIQRILNSDKSSDFLFSGKSLEKITITYFNWIETINSYSSVAPGSVESYNKFNEKLKNILLRGAYIPD